MNKIFKVRIKKTLENYQEKLKENPDTLPSVASIQEGGFDYFKSEDRYTWRIVSYIIARNWHLNNIKLPKSKRKGVDMNSITKIIEHFTHV